MVAKFLGITIPKDLYDKIEEKRKDLPRSYFYKKLLESGYNSNFLNKLVESKKHE